MQNAASEFRRENPRNKIQDLIDQETFTNVAGEQRILDYLEKPYETIVKKYESLYELSWEDLKTKFTTERTGKDVLKEFY